jgi:hypothetical protein
VTEPDSCRHRDTGGSDNETGAMVTGHAFQWKLSRRKLGEVVWNYTTQGQSFGQPVPMEQRTSNEFTLRR